jgi:hypothetical protein
MKHKLTRGLILYSPYQACVALRNYIARIKRIRDNEYKRVNERTYDIKHADAESKLRSFRITASVAVHNKNKDNAIKLINEAWDMRRQYTLYGKFNYGNCYYCGQPNYKKDMCHTQTCDMYR